MKDFTEEDDFIELDEISPKKEEFISSSEITYKPLYSQEKLLLIARESADGVKNQTKFHKKLEKEMNRFDEWCNQFYSEIQTNLYLIISKFGEKPVNLLKIENDTDAISNLIVDFNLLIGNTFKSWVKVYYKFCKLCKLPNPNSATSTFSDKILSEKKFCDIGFGDFVCMISDIYYTLGEMKKAKEKEAGQSETWVPPSAFIRSTIKYWIRLEDLTRVKLIIVKNLPLLRYRKRQGVNLASGPTNSYRGFAHLNNSYDNNGEGDGSQTTSIYFDNDKLRLYHDKIVRKEGATLVRVRWYGAEGSTCFSERKTWHDSWVLNDSIKERFDMKYKQISDFLTGTLTARAFVEGLQQTNKYNNKALCEILGLATTIQDRVLKLRLKPMLRTVYWRSAFQHTDNNRIRISIDTSLTLVKEPEIQEIGRWCRDMKKPIAPDEIVQFPLAVLEIKLSGVDEVPQWIQNLVDSPYVISAYKFSKFMHGISKLYGEKVNVLPPWFSRTAVHIPGYKLKHWYRQSTEFIPNKLPFWNVHRWQLSQPLGLPKEKLRKTHVFSGIPSDYSSAEEDPPSDGDDEIEDDEETVKLLTGIEFEGDVMDETSPIWGTEGRMQSRPPKTSGIAACYELDKKPKRAGLVPILQAIRSEPKTNFASERVFSKWISTSLFITIGALLFMNVNFGEFPRMVGAVLFSYAIILCIYALGVFQFRRRAIVQRSVDGHYDDKFGAIVMFGVLVLYFIFAVIFSVSPAPPVPQSRGFSRSYEFQLSPTAISSIGDISTRLREIQSSIVQSVSTIFPQISFTGSLDEFISARNITYYDTVQCTLKNHQFLLREIQGKDINGNSASNMALSHVVGDMRKLSLLDEVFNASVADASEIVRPGSQIMYQRSKLLPITSSHVPTLISATNYFETFDLWDVVNPSDWYLNLYPRNSVFTEKIFGSLYFNFGFPGRDLLIRVHAWERSGMPTLYELVMTYNVPPGQVLSSNEIIGQTKLFSNLQNNLGTISSQNSVDIVFGSC